MESSQFTHTQSYFESIEQIESQGATCDTFRVKLYGKLHFLKRLKPEYAGDIRYREALRKEFETGYQLEHPGLPRYISHSDDGILMDYIDGETLSQALQRRPDYFQNRKNTDKFLTAFDDDAASNVSVRIILIQDAINRLTQYDPEIIPVAEAFDPLTVINATNVSELKTQLDSAKEQIAAARNSLLD